MFVGGLVGAIIDSAANATSAGRMETAAAQLRQSLLDYDFPVTVQGALGQQFGLESSLPLPHVQVLLERDERQLDKVVAQADGDAVLVVVLDYRMDPEFAQVVVTADAYLCAKSDALRKKAVAQSYGRASLAVLYRNSFQSAWRAPEGYASGSGRDAMAPVWATEGGLPARTVLGQAAAEIAAMISWDLAVPAAPNYRPTRERGMMVQTYRNGTTLSTMGEQARTESGRVWLRLADGRMAAY